MTERAPIEAIWNGEAFTPVSPYWQRRADKEFARGEVLRLIHVSERSHNSHAHFFAQVTEAWRNLPALMTDRFPTAESLRKYALIKTGFFNSHSMPCASHAEAKKLAAFIRPMDEFAVVTVERNIVSVFHAKSQSRQAMDRKEFQDSKEKVLEYLATMLEVSKQELSDNTGKAA